MFKKNFLALFLLLFIIQLATAKNIVCTTYPVWLLTRSVTGGIKSANLSVLMPATQSCAHDYSPSAKDLQKIARNGTILIANGLGLDDHIVKAALRVNRSLTVITAGDAVHAKDMHSFIAPDTAAFMTKAIADKLGEIDQANRKIYQKNADNLCEKLNALRIRRRQLPDMVVLQTPLWINLAKFAGVKYIVVKNAHSAILNSTSLKKLLQTVKQNNISTLWQEADSPDPAIKMLKKSAILRTVELDTLQTGPQNPAADYLVQVMQSNLEKIAGKQK